MELYAEKAREYLKVFCNVQPNRRTGSMGNREATDFFQKTIRAYGYEIDATSFPVLDFVCTAATLTQEEIDYEVFASPYSLACDLSAETVPVSTVEELEQANCEGKILLLYGTICDEQIAPKNFIFYNPEEHQRIVSLIEKLKPGAIITATKKNPELAGALDPFPLFVDGDLDIPSVYCRAAVGDELLARRGTATRLKIDARRIDSSAANVLASLNRGKAKKIVLTAHIDAYESTPGALDNASGVIILLLAAEMLADYRGEYSLEIIAFNGEDHYSAAGEMDYLKRYGDEFPGILVAINMDGVGFTRGKSSYSFYECRPEFEEKVEKVFRRFEGLQRDEEWFSGDHMVLVQNEVPAIAITSELITELMSTVTHTSADTPDLVDCEELVEVAMALNDVVRAL